MPKKLFLGILSITLVLVLTSCSVSGSNSNPSSSGNIIPPDPPNIASIEGMGVFAGSLSVKLKPINAKPNEQYIVDLNEKGQLRERKNIVWNEPQINVKQEQVLYFSLTDDEYNAYVGASLKDSNWWKSIFDIKIHAILSTSTPSNVSSQQGTVVTPTITLISPNGNEIWHIGDKVTIKWASTNLAGGLSIALSYDSGKTWNNFIVPQTSNTGDYEWVVTGQTGTHCRMSINTQIRLAMGTTSDKMLSAMSASDFTISAK